MIRESRMKTCHRHFVYGAIGLVFVTPVSVGAFSALRPVMILRPLSTITSSPLHQIRAIRTPKLSATLIGDDYSGESNERMPVRWEQWANFCHGADYVNNRYLALFWEFNFQRTMPWLVLLSVLLLGSQAVAPNIGLAVFDFLKFLCASIFVVASAFGGALQFPFEALRWIISLLPAVVIPMIEYLPSRIAVGLVKVLLDLHSAMNVLFQSNFVVGITVVFWRPIVEEVQYRYIFGKILRSEDPEAAGVNGDYESSSSFMVEFIPVDGSHGAEAKILSTSSDESLSSSSLRTPKSRRLLLSSIAFASTRLGWFCAHPDTVQLTLPFSQTAASPYSGTVAFMQSAATHFSSRVLAELSPFLQRSLMLLAIQQTISTFLVTWYVFVPLYQEKGVAASIGAHVAWTFGKLTWPLRLLLRLLELLANQLVVPPMAKFFLDRKR